VQINNLEQSPTGSEKHRPGDSLSVGLRTGYSSVHKAGGVSDRR